MNISKDKDRRNKKYLNTVEIKHVHRSYTKKNRICQTKIQSLGTINCC